MRVRFADERTAASDSDEGGDAALTPFAARLILSVPTRARSALVTAEVDCVALVVPVPSPLAGTPPVAVVAPVLLELPAAVLGRAVCEGNAGPVP